MGFDRKLSEWQAAGLIDATAAAAIREHEAREGRPIALWAMIALGLLALSLGSVLVIAANWDLIAPGVKLGVHGLLTVVAAYAVWRGLTQGQRWLAEGTLFLLGALVLGGIALQGQIYQLVAPVSQALLFWALLSTPIFILAGTTHLTAISLALMLAWLAAAGVADARERWDFAATSFGLALPGLLVALSLAPLPGRQADDDAFRRGLRDTGTVLLLGGASIAHFAWAATISGREAAELGSRSWLALLAAGAVAWLARRHPSDVARVLTPVTAVATGFATLALVVPHGDDWAARLTGALAFGAMWAIVAWAAARGGRRLLFGFAVGAIALRLFIVYFELFGTLATTGAGLIVGGLLIIALALASRRIIAHWSAIRRRVA